MSREAASELLKILVGNKEVLRTAARPVTDEMLQSGEAQRIVADLKAVLQDVSINKRTGEYTGAHGLAAPQIGIGYRVFVLHRYFSKKSLFSFKSGHGVFINPEIITKSGSTCSLELCYSVGKPHIMCRSRHIEVRAQDEQGNWFTVKVSGARARTIQHEIDHLNGILIDTPNRERTL